MKQCLWIIITLFFLSCDKSEHCDQRIHGNIQMTSTFDSSSYIILHDSINNTNDSLYYQFVTHQIGYPSYYSYDSYQIEYLIFNFSSRDSVAGKKKIMLQYRASGGCIGGFLFVKPYVADSSSLTIFSLPEKLIFSEPNQYGVKKIPTMVVRGKSHQTVFENTVTDGVNTATIWYSLYDGIIKMDLSNPNFHKVYELEDFYFGR